MTSKPKKVTALRAAANVAAKKIIAKDNIDPTPEQIWGVLPCKEYPDGVIGLAELIRMERPEKPEPVKTVDLLMLPYGRGKLIGSE